MEEDLISLPKLKEEYQISAYRLGRSCSQVRGNKGHVLEMKSRCAGDTARENHPRVLHIRPVREQVTGHQL